MGKLTNLRSTIRSLPPALAFASDRDEHGHSRTAEHWRKWYSLARWKRLRLKVLLRDVYTCQMPSCGRLEPDTSQLVADHRLPHRGDPALFWDEGNVQTLCKPCHDSLKQAQERRGAGLGRG